MQNNSLLRPIENVFWEKEKFYPLAKLTTFLGALGENPCFSG